MNLDIRDSEYTPLPRMPMSIQSYASYTARGWFGVSVTSQPCGELLGFALFFCENTPATKRHHAELPQQKLCKAHSRLGAILEIFETDGPLRSLRQSLWTLMRYFQAFAPDIGLSVCMHVLICIDDANPTDHKGTRGLVIYISGWDPWDS